MKKYTILIIKDDSSARRLQTGGMFPLLVVLLFIVLVAWAAGSTYMGFTLWHDSRKSAENAAALKQELSQTQNKLNRLENLEKFLTFFEDNGTSIEPGGNVSLNAEQIQKVLDPQEGTQPDPEVDANMVDIINVRLRQEGAGRLGLHFRIHNLQQGSPAQGTTHLDLLTTDGALVPVPAQAIQGGRQFRINRYKPMDMSFQLPEGGRDTVKEVQVTITAPEGTIILRKRYPLQDHLTE